MNSMWADLLISSAVLSVAWCACPNTWVKHGSSCYAIFNTTATFVDAVKKCDEFGGSHLAEIESKTENDFLKNELQNRHSGSVFVGGSDLLIEGNWVWGKSGDEIHFSDWHTGEPTQTGSGVEEDCLTMWEPYSYQWGDIECSRKLNFVCEMPDPTPQTSCPVGWTRYGSSCYALYNTPASSFSEASQYCSIFGGGFLAEIETEMENIQIKNYTVSQNTQNMQGVWLGATDFLIEGMWMWDKTETPMIYTDWYKEQPDDNGKKQQNCLALWKAFSFHWIDHYCSTKLSFLCEMPAK